ncbi:MAG: inositol monophosphatase family protein [Candidatus Nanopelagicales bacterium]
MSDSPDAASVTAESTDLAIATYLADIADEVTLSHFRSRTLQIETKADLTPVTQADTQVEQEIRARLTELRPDDLVLGEEFGGDTGLGRRWIIDPIDGTKNYVRGVPVWATLIALAVEDDFVLGVVSAPALGRRWWAQRSHGSWTRGPEDSDNRRLAVSSVDNMSDASVSCSDSVGWNGDAWSALGNAAGRWRAYGDFWSHLLVAEGAVDIAAEPELSLWDIAALVPIIEEAGGKITGFDGARVSDSAVTTNGRLHDKTLRLIWGG